MESTSNIVDSRKRSSEASIGSPHRKVPRSAAPPSSSAVNFFDRLTDNLVVCILCKLSSSARCPADLVRVLLTCKRFNDLGRNPLVLSKASTSSLAIRAQNWSDDAHKFLKRCVDAGNRDATYILGMITCYCLRVWSGLNMIVKAAQMSHADALYSLAVMKLNGLSPVNIIIMDAGGRVFLKDHLIGTWLLHHSAKLGHLDASHELAYCLMDGFGHTLRACQDVLTVLKQPAREPHPANRFLVEWFAARPVGPELRLCSNGSCGRPETRKNEFRRCACCGLVQYCSRACRAVNSKLHRVGGVRIGWELKWMFE